MRKKPKELFFLYKLAPFRPLYLNTPLGGGPAFMMPLSKTDLSALSARNRPALWLIGDKALARSLAHLNKAMYDKKSDYAKIAARGEVRTPKPTSAMKRDTERSILEELA